MVKSEKKEISNNNILVNAADKVGLETELFCKESYVSSSTEKFNEEATIKEWVGEYSYFTTYHMLPLSSDRMNQISEKYGTDYILLSGIEALKYKKANAVWSVFYAIVVYPAAPYYLYQAFSYEHQNIYYNFLINTKNGEIVLTDLRETTQKEKELNSRSLIYDVMYQIKNEKNEK